MTMHTAWTRAQYVADFVTHAKVAHANGDAQSVRTNAALAARDAEVLQAESDASLREAQSHLRQRVAVYGWLEDAGTLDVVNRELYRRYLRGPKGLQVHLGQGVTQGVL